MGNFHQISTELLHLVGVENLFPLSNLIIFLLIFFTLCIRGVVWDCRWVNFIE